MKKHIRLMIALVMLATLLAAFALCAEAVEPANEGGHWVINAEKIDEILDMDIDGFDRFLSTAGIPDPDLIVRTSGECRLSNYFLWQGAYSELLFVDTLWPDFRKDEFRKAIEYYTKRDRRYGKVK